MTRPDHLFVTSDGVLYDTRPHDWHRMAALRPLFSQHVSIIRSLAGVKACLRAGPFTFPGFYPIYFITHDGAALSFKAVREQWREVVGSFINGTPNDGWRVVACVINYEDDDLFCDHTGESIPSAYAD